MSAACPSHRQTTSPTALPVMILGGVMCFCLYELLFRSVESCGAAAACRAWTTAKAFALWSANRLGHPPHPSKTSISTICWLQPGLRHPAAPASLILMLYKSLD